MPHFFISYAKKDTRELALALADALDALEGVTVWVDRSLLAGKSWERQIETEIDRCDFMIVLYSPDINRHKQGKEESYVLTEIAYAQRTAKKPIIPVMAQETDAPISLTRAHYIDFTLPGLKLNDLVAEVCRVVGIVARPKPPLPFNLPGVQTAWQDEEDTGGFLLLDDTSRSILSVPPPTQQSPVYPRQSYSYPPQHAFPPPSAPVTRKPRSIDILPQPFAWIEIPGSIGKKWRGAPFAIAKYPVTNTQFAKFVEADGYSQSRWWTAAGWHEREKNEWNQPRYWRDSKWNGADQPVVGVSWYEAVAFCLWLSDITGEKIMLPTEDQWQYAAQGDDGRTYPWGNRWDRTRCNNSVRGWFGGGRTSDRTTPVRQYEGVGDSPFGVVDMAGNVWEWCVTKYHSPTDNNLDGTDVRVLRGGSWDGFNSDIFRADYRNRGDPNNRDNYGGFRVARSS